MALKQAQGRRVFGVEMKIVDDAGTRQPHDGQAMGELFVRGNTVAAGYHDNAGATARAIDADGWFGTGDIASISADGILTLRDRAKDLIKSGGEWISSIDVENLAVAHPDVAQCAVIALPHPKWDERPLLVIKPKVPPDLGWRRCGPIWARIWPAGSCPMTSSMSTRCPDGDRQDQQADPAGAVPRPRPARPAGPGG
ncbi:hypothetical protein FLP41_08965 [Paracoccus marcusii]|uniref:AMP-binding enzyme n=1 Tax=Paracoccus marcusii TaxID=59779 RepID=UPI002ED4E5F7|nr:hypothetical protein FLP41_08965 [Paracoccus marcusii]